MIQIRSIILLWCILLTAPVFSQNFSIVNTDASKYPLIQSTVRVEGNANAQQSDFNVLEDRKELEFTLKDQGNEAARGKAVFFLVETSGLTQGKVHENIKNALLEVLDKVSPATQVNIGYFNRTDRDTKALNLVNNEFTADKASLKKEVKNEITASQDKDYAPDIYKSIDEALDFIASKQNLPSDKRLIVISTTINGSRSPIRAEDVIEKASRQSVPVYTLTYKTGDKYAPDNFVRISNRTNAKTAAVQSKNEINSALIDFISVPASTGATKDYVLEFTTNNPKNGRIYQYEVRYKGERRAATYSTPEEEEEGLFEGYGLFIVLLVLAIGGGLFWFVKQSGKAKVQYQSGDQAEQQDRLRASEEKEIYEAQMKRHQEFQPKPPPQSVPRRNDLKNTMIAGATTSPTLAVKAGDFNDSFTLTKSQTTIGRAAGNDIVIPEQTVSGKHAVITQEGGDYFITDVGSTNGTYVNSLLINGKHKLVSGVIIKMGAAQLTFQHS